MNAIEHIIEPDRLILSWQALETQTRDRFVIGELLRNSQGITFRYLRNLPDFERASSAGFVGYPAFRRKRPGSACNYVMETFLRRLPPKRRGDYGKYLSMHGLRPSQQMSDFALLGYLKCKLPGDGFEIVQLFENAVVGQPFELIIEVAGFRYNAEVPIEEIPADSSVEFLLEPTNPHDNQAIAITWEGSKIGYVDRIRTETFHRLIDQGASVRARVHSRNGTSDRPILYLFVQVNSSGY